jgi:hypothetical protein
VNEVSDTTFCVVDNGLFLPIAQRLAEEAKRVLYTPASWQRGFCSIKQACIGSGFDNLEHCLDFWTQLDEIDCFVFPDIGNSGLQLHLESLGKAVWGSRNGDSIEVGRERFMRQLEAIGLEVAPHQVVVGLGALREHLRPLEDKYIKISRWRGDMETTHWRNWNMDAGWLDWLAVNLGPLKDTIRFLVFDKIETDLEIGGDIYCVDGKWPSIALNGLEWKDSTYFAAVTNREHMPDQIQFIMEAIGPYLEEHRYRNQISFEVRVKDDCFYWIDATQRGGMPSTASQLALWKNFPEIVLAGAQGELVEPEPAANFSIECMVKSKGDAQTWDSADIADELKPWLKLSSCCYHEGSYVFPPDESHAGDLGWLVAIANTPRETLERAKELADMLPDGLDANLENLTGLIQEIEQAGEQGIPFTDEQLPEPADVIED